MTGRVPDPDELEAARKLFARECRFVAGVAVLDQVPDSDLPEVAFAGRSNVGKSSLINALTGRKTLARTSNTPGRTQQLNFFDLDGRLMIVDLPGYGYARVSKAKVKAWTGLVRDYLRGRPVLRRAFVLVDGRHGLKESDRDVMDMLDEAAVAYQIVLTKCDKVGAGELEKTRSRIETDLKRRPAANPRVLATSARKDTGIAEVRVEIAALAAS